MSKESNTYKVEEYDGLREIIDIEEVISSNPSRKRIQFVETSIVKTSRIHIKYRYITSPDIAANLGKALLDGVDIILTLYSFKK